MMETARRQPAKSRQKIAAEAMTKTEQVYRQLRSGPIPNELRTVQEAIFLASAFTRQAKEAMLAKGLNPDTLVVVIAYMTPDLSVLHTRKFVPGAEKHLQNELAAECCIMAGLIFGIRDPDHNNEWLVGEKPFLNTPLVRSALSQRIESEVLGIN